MIEGVELKTPVDSRLGNTVVNSSSIMGGLTLKIAHGLDDSFSELTANSGEAIIALLQNKISFQRPIFEKSSTWYGKIFNRLTNQKHNRIEIKGIVLLAILKLLMETADVDVYPQGLYDFPFSEAERTVKRLIELA